MSTATASWPVLELTFPARGAGLLACRTGRFRVGGRSRIACRLTGIGPERSLINLQRQATLWRLLSVAHAGQTHAVVHQAVAGFDANMMRKRQVRTTQSPFGMTFINWCGRINRYFSAFVVIKSIAKSHFYMLCREFPNGLSMPRAKRIRKAALHRRHFLVHDSKIYNNSKWIDERSVNGLIPLPSGDSDIVPEATRDRFI